MNITYFAISFIYLESSPPGEVPRENAEAMCLVTDVMAEMLQVEIVSL